MNWLQRLMTNPNAHSIAAIGTLALGIFAPEVLPLAKAAVAAAGLATSATLLPEQPEHVVMPGPVAPIAEAPVVLPSGTSMHKDDYAALLNGIAQILSDAKGRQ